MRIVRRRVFNAEWQQMWSDLRPLNPDKSDEELKRYVDLQIADGRSDQRQFIRAFGDSYPPTAPGTSSVGTPRAS
jgi:hypothetical protein